VNCDVAVLGRQRDEDRTPGTKYEKMVAAIYRFFRNVCADPKFNPADWYGLNGHAGRVTDSEEKEKTRRVD
jgi:hypothetical protein